MFKVQLLFLTLFFSLSPLVTHVFNSSAIDFKPTAATSNSLYDSTIYDYTPTITVNGNHQKEVRAFGRFSETKTPFGVALAKKMRHQHLSESKGKITHEKYKISKIVIDAGHGGYDSGCLSNDVQEKDIALGIAKKLKTMVAQKYPDVEIIMTREQDVFVPLKKRAQLANASQADLFISIHANYFPAGSRTHGTETYVLGPHKLAANLEVAKRENAAIKMEDNYQQHYNYDPDSPEGHILLSMYQNAYLEQSLLFAAEVEDNFQSGGDMRSRGVKQAGFLVLRETAMPSVLIETGYLSNEKDRNYLNTSAGQTRIANQIEAAFGDYKRTLEGSTFNESATTAAAATTPPPMSVRKETATNYPPRQVVKSVSSPAATASKVVQYRVQLLASKKPVNLNQNPWNKLQDFMVEVTQEGGYYKYQACGFSTYSDAQKASTTLRKKGFSDSWIVAYHGGQQITLSEARALSGK